MQIEFITIVAALAGVLYILSFSLKNEVKFRLANMGSSALWSGYYALLGNAWAGCAMFAIGAVRHAVSLVIRNHSAQTKTTAAAVFAVLSTIGLYFSWKGPLSLLPWLAVMNATYAYVCLQGVRLRVQLAIGNPLWIVYGVLVGAWGHVAVETVSLLLNLHLIWRLKREMALQPV